MNIFLFTTSIISEKSMNDLHSLVKSIRENKEYLDDVTIVHYVLLQNAVVQPDLEIDFLTQGDVRVSTIEGKTALSNARNILLEKALHLIGDDDLVAFPDDDAWYPAGVLSRFVDKFKDAPQLDFLFCKYGTTANEWPILEPVEVASVRLVVRNASSNTIFLRGKVAKTIGGFNANLGVGTRNNGGEDIEYALRAFANAKRTEYVPVILIGHRDKFLGMRAKYYKGNVLALRANASKGRDYMVEYLRKLLIGCFLTMKGELSAKDFFSVFLHRI